MFRFTTRRRDGERGQILALFAGSLLVLVFVVGLVIDAGFAFAGRRDAQNVSDLASVAGTRMLAEYYIGAEPASAIYPEVVSVTDANGCTAASGCTWTASYVDTSHVVVGSVTPSGGVPASAVGVRVDVNRPTDTVLVGNVMRLLNQGGAIDSWDVNTTATAMTGSTRQIAGGGVLLPIAFLEPETGLKAGVEYEMTDENLDSPGSFGWLSWTGDEAAGTLMNSVCSSDNAAFNLPGWLESSSGAKNAGGVTDAGIKACLENYMNNGIPVLIPIYGTGCSGTSDPIKGTGTLTEYCIIGIAEMRISALDWAPVVKGITGSFSKTFAYKPGAIPANLSIAPPAFGETTYMLSLVR